jgi:NADH-quinone oxidoreductase subunit E
MLSPEQRSAIESLTGRYPDARAASVEALKLVQESEGWVSDDDLRQVAEVLDISEAALEAVATFYNLIFRHPVGDHVILVCDSVSCWVMGLEEIVAACRERLGIGFGETTEDGRFTLLPVPCLGACDGAPALMIDADLHVNVHPEDLEKILANYPSTSREAE